MDYIIAMTQIYLDTSGVHFKSSFPRIQVSIQLEDDEIKQELMHIKSDKKVDTASLLVDVDDGSETTVTADMKVQTTRLDQT